MKPAAISWKRALAVGCGIVLACALALSIVAAANWGRVTALYRSVSSQYSEMQVVRAAIQSEYNTPQVIIKNARRLGAPGPILVVQVVNPPFLSQVPDTAIPAKAREIALLASSAYPSREAVDTYEIVIVSQRGIGFTFSRAHVHQFKAAELRSPAPPTAETDADAK